MGIFLYNIMSKQQSIIVIQDPEYEVEQILNRKCTKNGVMYLIKWKNYSVDEASWEPVNNLYNSMDIVKAYQKNRKKGISENSGFHVLNFDQSSQEPKSRKKTFNEDLIFPKPPLKKQTLIQQLQRTPPQKKIIKKQKKQKKIIKKQQQDKEIKQPKDNQIEENFCVVISQSEQQAQNQEPKPVPTVKVTKDDIHEQVFPSSQENASGSKNQNEFWQPSLNLSELEDEENQRLTLQNLNPDIFVPSLISPDLRKKLVRMDKPANNIRLLTADDPHLKNKKLKIDKIAKIENKWLALVSLRKQVLGYIPAETLQKKNCKLMLDYLYDLLHQ